MSSSQNSCVLPENMIMEILSWLPVKDLVRFKCVSKRWTRLIYDSAFVKLHLQRSSSKSTHVLLTFDTVRMKNYAIVCPVQDLLDNPSSTLETLHHKHSPFNGNYRFFGVCNDLACLQDSCSEDEFEEYWFRIWNPATRVMSKDSPHIRVNTRDVNYRFWLMFGFGYDDQSDTYQVVFLDKKNQEQKMEVRVYCFGDTCWRSVLICDSVPIAISLGTFVSGTLNWLVYPKLCSDDEVPHVKIKDLKIFSYHLKKETCSYFSMPDGILEVYPIYPDLEVLKGCLCFSYHHMGNLVVWLKREFSDEKSWYNLFTLSYEDDPNLIPYYCRGSLEIICMGENDNVVLLANTNMEAEFSWYNIKDNRIDGREPYNNDKFFLKSYDYVQSLALPYRN